MLEPLCAPTPLPLALSPVAEAPALADWQARLERATLDDRLCLAAGLFGDRVAMVTSFQAEGMVLLDRAHALGLRLRVVTVDTGRLPEETFRHIDRVRERYGCTIEVFVPESRGVEQLVRIGGPNLFLESKENRERCCFVRKVEPFRRATAGLDAWISGLRRGQGGERVETSALEVDHANRDDGTLLKVNPLFDWSEEQVWSYLRTHHVPYHPLYDHGYRSIGCAPCTRASRPGEDARAGRWWWEQGHKECGLHRRRATVVAEEVA